MVGVFIGSFLSFHSRQFGRWEILNLILLRLNKIWDGRRRVACIGLVAARLAQLEKAHVLMYTSNWGGGISLTTKSRDMGRDSHDETFISVSYLRSKSYIPHICGFNCWWIRPQDSSRPDQPSLSAHHGRRFSNRFVWEGEITNLSINWALRFILWSE